MRFVYLTVAVAVVMLALPARPANAIVQFYKEYDKLYLENHPDKDYVALVRKGTNKCLVCHQGKNRKHHNPFGIHLVEPLDRKKDLRNTEKIIAEIKKVMEMPVDPKDKDGETYADRVEAGEWPGGEFEELKKEAPEEAGGN